MWMSDNCLTVNVDKSELLFITPKNKQDQFNEFAIKIDDKTFSSPKTLKSLGLTLDSGLTWNEHIITIKSKCNKTLWSIRALKNIIQPTHVNTLLKTLVFPKLYYIIAIWDECIPKFFKQVTKIVNSAKRMIKYDVDEITWLNPVQQYKYVISIMTHQSKHQGCPETFKNKIKDAAVEQRATRHKTHYFID